MAVALLALVVGASGGAYAAVTASSTTVTACVHHAGGGLYEARTCAPRDRRLAWSVTGPRGETGSQGPQGPVGSQGPEGSKGTQGPQGPSGSGAITTIPLVDLPNRGSGPLVDVPGVGKLEVTFCATVESEFRYTNESTGTQNYIFMSAFDGQNDVLPDGGTVAAGSSFTVDQNTAHDLIRVSLSDGSKVVDVELAQSRNGTDCVYWGEVFPG